MTSRSAGHRKRKPVANYSSNHYLTASSEDFYHVEQLCRLLGNKLTRPLTVLGHLRDGKRVSRRTVEGAVRDLQAIAEHPLLTVTDAHVHSIHS